MVTTAQRIHDDIEAADPTTADLLYERVEQVAWMVPAEIRVPGASVPDAIRAGREAHDGPDRLTLSRTETQAGEQRLS